DPGLPGGTLDESTLAAGNYSYYVTFYNTASGLESRPTSLIGPEPVTVGDRRIRLQNIPQPTSGDFDGVRIYRNLATDTNQFFRVAELTGGETSYIDGASDATIEIPGNELNRDGPAVNFALKLVDVVRLDEGTDTYDNVFREGTLFYTPEKGGRQMGTKQLTVDPNTTVQDLINFMEEASGIQEVSPDPTFPIPGNPGGGINGLSQLEFVSNMGQDNALGDGKFELIATDGTKDVIDLGFGQTQEAEGQSAFTDFVVYDSLGVGLNVRLTTVLESSSDTGTTYRWYADSSDNDPATGSNVSIGTGVITFDQKGDVSSVSDATVSIDRRNVASESPLNIELDFTELVGLNAPEALMAASRQDGFPPGVLSSFIISETGRIRGVFSNGVTRDLGQVRMARFANNTGLEQAGENLFSGGENSGLPVEGNPGEQGIGTVTAGAVELSNTDIGQNLIDLILASTQYRGGTRVITAVQQLLDELMAIRR
ncbi:MAG: flagellar hook-basal body complex protein, partial [Pirellulales bacterium]